MLVSYCCININNQKYLSFCKSVLVIFVVFCLVLSLFQINVKQLFDIVKWWCVDVVDV